MQKQTPPTLLKYQTDVRTAGQIQSYHIQSQPYQISMTLFINYMIYSYQCPI